MCVCVCVCVYVIFTLCLTLCFALWILICGLRFLYHDARQVWGVVRSEMSQLVGHCVSKVSSYFVNVFTY
jgi:hypothetical protein